MSMPPAAPPPYEYPQQQQPVGQKYNVLAIISLVTSIIGISLAGIICGHIALSQIKRTGESGRGMAIAGTIIGYVGLVLSIIAVIWTLSYLPTIIDQLPPSRY
ncbi:MULTISPECIES: DUF4190 domain-containing protein [unclassified Salinibacterium]|uniref:DUF4190 domain-containing protein n=1 Tax=unclassified Salinibacterium TaxID=2632331 RepID=UPI00141D97E0|nr:MULTISPECIES: DUF4190 domain-containing protein [unclassified Salinibacterium]